DEASRLPRAREDRGELLAAVACRQIHCPRLRAKHLGESDQRSIARLVPVGVVERLEVVQVVEHEAKRSTTPRRGELALQEQVELTTVRQPDERVRQREVAELGVQTGVLDRRRRVWSQTKEQVDPLLVGDLAAPRTDRQESE